MTILGNYLQVPKEEHQAILGKTKELAQIGNR
jgi:hypothetical protein